LYRIFTKKRIQLFQIFYMKIKLLIFFLSIGLLLNAQRTYRTQSLNPDIKTLQIGVEGEKMGLPIIELNRPIQLQISFDEMSHIAHSYSYKVIHCNSDWTPSNLNSSEYLSGYSNGSITDYNHSINTTYLYTHYSFTLPNDEMSFKISGNYVIIIYEDNNYDQEIATICFSIVEPQINISANVRGNTDKEMNTKWQQLDFNLGLNGFTVKDPTTEFNVVVRQNNRTDNQVIGIKPTYISNSKLSYINHKSLIFEAGYEYHRFDISSVYAGGEGVDKIRFEQPAYHAYLYPNKIKMSKIYMQEMDVNGKFIVNVQNAHDDRVEADYINVHFNLESNQPFFDGQIFLGGELNHNLMNDFNRMNFDLNTNSYTSTILLKQGGYNYQYWFKPKGENKASCERIDGSFWQTRNEYTIYVYHRGWGDRYDKLVGVKTLE